MSTRALVRLPLARLSRSPRGWLAIAAWSALALVAAWLERAHGGENGADRALLGGLGTLALPLAAYAVVGAVLASDGLREAVRPTVAFGASPARVTVATVGTPAAGAAIVGALLAGGVALVAGSPSPVFDFATSAWIGALAGAAYAAWFCMGACFGPRGAGRSVLLVVDYLLGSASSAAALLTPRGHLRNLLGGTPPAELSQRASSALLVALAFVCLLVCVRRTR